MGENHKELNHTGLHIGNNIDEILRQLGVKKVELAETLGKTREHIYKILKNENVNTEILEKIHEVYGVPYTLFFTEKEKINVKVSGNYNSISEIGLKNKNEIANIERENESLQREIALLKEMVQMKDDLINELRKKK